MRISPSKRQMQRHWHRSKFYASADHPKSAFMSADNLVAQRSFFGFFIYLPPPWSACRFREDKYTPTCKIQHEPYQGNGRISPTTWGKPGASQNFGGFYVKAPDSAY